MQLLLALLVQVASPSPMATFQVPAGIPTAAPPVPGAPHVTLRRSPGPMPTKPNEAQIFDSGSTNTAGYEVRLSTDGSARASTPGGVIHTHVSRANTARLFSDLRAAGPLDAIPSQPCMKSASFGSTLTVSYRGRRSPDLSCGADDPHAAALARDAAAIATELGIATIHGGPRRTL